MLKNLEVIPKPALVAKMRNFFRRQGGRNSNSCCYGDAGRRRPAEKRAICSPNEVLGWLLVVLTAVFICFCSGCDKQSAEKKGETMAAKVRISTTMGDIVVELNSEKAPVTCKNFLQYVGDKFYDGTIFHRVIKGFMIQGGGMTADMSPKQTRPPIANEANNGLKNDRGTIAMARTSNPDSATSQFFINHANNDFLNYGVRDAGYAVFGRVTEGMDIVDKIASVATRPGDVPVETITINSISVE